MRPGQKMKFVYIRGDPDVHPWEMPGSLVLEQIDKEKYIELLARAASSVLYPFGVDSDELKRWAHTATIELRFNFGKEAVDVRSIYDHAGPRGFSKGFGIRGPAIGIQA